MKNEGEEENGSKMPKQVRWVITGLILVIGIASLAFLAQGYSNHEKTTLRPTFSDPRLKVTVPFKLEPGQKLRFEPYDRQYGELYEFTVEWTVYSDESRVQSFINGVYGTAMTADTKGARLLYPSEGSQMSESGNTNHDVHYIHFHNVGPDVVEGELYYWGRDVIMAVRQ